MRRALRLLAVVAALTLAAGTPAAGAPSLTASGCPLFPPDNVWHADVSRLPAHPRSGAYLAAIGRGAAPSDRDPGAAPPGRDPGAAASERDPAGSRRR